MQLKLKRVRGLFILLSLGLSGSCFSANDVFEGEECVILPVGCGFCGDNAHKPVAAGKKQAKANQQKTPICTHFPHIFDPHSLKGDNGLWVEVDALAWQSNVGSLNYAVESNSTSSVSHGHVKDLDFKWDWGIRAGLGYKLPHDKWDIFIDYTYVHAHADAHAHKENGALYPNWATAFGFTGDSFYATRANAHWHANLNMGDVELGRNCFAGKWLTLRPFFGVRGLVIDQNYRVKYSGGTAFPGEESKISLDTDFWAWACVLA